MSRPTAFSLGQTVTSDPNDPANTPRVLEIKRLFDERIVPLRDVLEKMTADDLADMCRREGIKGKIDDGCECPLARWWNKIMPEAKGTVAANAIQLESDNPEKLPQFTLSRGMRDFIIRFDAGEFPDLVEQ